MKIGIIILSWNSKDYIDNCLKGLLKFETSNIYVVDNGSEDGSPAYIAQNYPNVKLISSPVNLGFASGNNLGIKQAFEDGCDAVFLLNNDTIIDESFIEPCVKILEAYPSIGIVGPVVVEADAADIVQCIGGKISRWNLGFPYIGRGERYKRRKYFEAVGYVLGAAMLIRREVIEKTGGFDPEYYPAYVEEADLCYRARLLGYQSVVSHECRVRHIGNKSSGNRDNSFRRFTKNRFLFGLKHLNIFHFLMIGQIIIWKVFLRKFIRNFKNEIWGHNRLP